MKYDLERLRSPCLIVLPLIMGALTGAALAAGDEWTTYSSKEGRFSASFPSEPTETTALPPFGVISVRMIEVKNALRQHYGIYVFDAPSENETRTEDARNKLFDVFRDLFPKAEAERTFKDFNVRETRTTLQGYPGKEFQFRSGQAIVARAHIYLTPRYVYILMVQGVVGEADSDRFVRSFKFGKDNRDALWLYRIEENGGNEKSEAAVAAGLAWLARHQSEDGRWSLDRFHVHGKCNCSGPGQSDDVAGTAIALLPFLATRGNQNKGWEYARSVQQGIKYLVSQQDTKGKIGRTVRSHSLATIALCEAYGLTGEQESKDSAQRALNWLVSAQDQNGGWKEDDKAQADLLVVAWSFLALVTGRMAKLEAPVDSLKAFGRFLDSRASPEGGRYGRYGRPNVRLMDSAEPASAAGLLCRMYLGWGPRNPGMINGINELRKVKPSVEINDMLYYHFATDVMRLRNSWHRESVPWREWNRAMRDLLIASQDKGSDPKTSHQQGSWAPAGDAADGRLMATSLAILTLEVYYRHSFIWGTSEPERREILKLLK